MMTRFMQKVTQQAAMRMGTKWAYRSLTEFISDTKASSGTKVMFDAEEESLEKW